MLSRVVCLLLVLIMEMVCAAGSAHGQTAGMGLNPTRVEVDALPGQERTASFEIESPPSEVVVRGRLLLSLTDWNVNEDGTIEFTSPGAMPDSASSWIVFSPAAVTIASGQTQLVRVTVRVPKETRAGVYRAGIFVQERPPATSAKRGEHLVYVRFRYVFSLYVTVAAVTSAKPELADVYLQPNKSGVRVICEMRNDGMRQVRPIVTWTLRNSQQAVVAAAEDYEAVVVLGGHTLKQWFPIGGALPPGDYEIRAEVDFQDGGPIQSVRRNVKWDSLAQNKSQP